MSEADKYDRFMGYDQPDDDDDDLDDGWEICPECMGMRTVPCNCGGDLCFCANDGDAPCPVCHEDGEVTHERADAYYDKQRKFAEFWAKIHGGSE